MRLILSLFLGAMFFTSSGQQIKFNEELIDTVTINSHLSVYQFDENGTVKGKENFFIIAFDQDKNEYFVFQYYQVETIRATKIDSTEVERKKRHSLKTINYNTKDLEQLINALTQTTDSSLLLNQFDTTEIKKYVSNIRIRKVALRNDIHWRLSFLNLTKRERDSLFELSRSMDNFNNYLKDRFLNKGYPITSDISSGFLISITTTKSKYYYQATFPNLVRQPWYYFGDTAYHDITPVLNFNINKSLKEILPNKFFNLKILSNEALYNDYIYWNFRKWKFIY